MANSASSTQCTNNRQVLLVVNLVVISFSKIIYIACFSVILIYPDSFFSYFTIIISVMTAVTFPLRPPRLAFAICGWRWQNDVNEIKYSVSSDTTLRSRLVRPKDPADPSRQDGVVYKIPCECSKVYIGETGRPMQERIKNTTETSASFKLKTQPFQNTPMKSDTSRFGKKLSLLIVITTGTRGRWKRQFTEDCTLITSTGITELNIQKRGCRPSRNTTNTRRASGPLRKTQQATSSDYIVSQKKIIINNTVDDRGAGCPK